VCSIDKRSMPRITKDVWEKHAPSAQELTIPRVPTKMMLAIVLAWLVVGLAVDKLASALWAVMAP
jgi:hypothetical protein